MIQPWSKGQPLVVLIDVDGVLANFNELVVRSANQIYGTKHDWRRAGGNYDILAPWPELDEQLVMRWMRRNVSAIDMESLRPDAWQSGLMYWMDHDEIDVRFVTTSFRSPGWERDRAAWLADVFFEEEAWAYQRTIFTSDKSLVMGDLLLEDNPNNCAAWLKKNLGGQVILFPDAMHSHEEAWASVFQMLEEKTK